MALYVVLHHRRDPNQPWVNSWFDDERIEAIQTTLEIGKLCKRAQDDGDLVFVHRCGFDGDVPIVCCAARVAQSAPVDRGTYSVTFCGTARRSLVPPLSPARGQNFYIA
jgi:hypothetical protein